MFGFILPDRPVPLTGLIGDIPPHGFRPFRLNGGRLSPSWDPAACRVRFASE